MTGPVQKRYESIRRGASFAKFIKNLTILRENCPDVQLFMSVVAMRQNIEEAVSLVRMAKELGFEEMFENDGVCVIEWPMYIQDILPQERLEIHMTKNSDQTRRMTFVPYGEKYQQLLEEMKICYSL